MKYWFALFVFGVALVTLNHSPQASAEDPKVTPPKGFTALFNGKNLDGWKGAIPINKRNALAAQSMEQLAKLQKEYDAETLPHWTIQDGAIYHDGKGGKFGANLATVKDYANFELFIDWKIEKGGDSGLYLRGNPQVQIWDSDNLSPSLKEDFHTGSGGLWNNAKGAKGKVPLKKADKPVGEWNTFHITMIGDKVTIKLNDILVVDDAPLANYWERGKPLPSLGPIELQHHGDKLWFKNIFVKELK